MTCVNLHNQNHPAYPVEQSNASQLVVEYYKSVKLINGIAHAQFILAQWHILSKHRLIKTTHIIKLDEIISNLNSAFANLCITNNHDWYLFHTVNFISYIEQIEAIIKKYKKMPNGRI